MALNTPMFVTNHIFGAVIVFEAFVAFVIFANLLSLAFMCFVIFYTFHTFMRGGVTVWPGHIGGFAFWIFGTVCVRRQYALS